MTRRATLDALCAGRTAEADRLAGEAFVLGHKTVARHLSNIFTKLGTGSRTAAAADVDESDRPLLAGQRDRAAAA